MPVDVRTLSESDFDAYLGVDEAAFSSVITPADRAQLADTIDWPRALGAFDGEVMCGTSGAYAVEVTVPGLATLATSAVTAVGVLPTHRRRGVLRALMARQLDDVAARGEALAVLTASEATIYGRFGYGVATAAQTVEVVRDRGAFAAPVPDGLPLRLVTKAEAQESAPAWFDAARRAVPGQISRPDSWWPVSFGDLETWRGGGEMFVVVCEPAGTAPGGYATYKVIDATATAPRTLIVREVVAASDGVAGALWRFLLDVDLVHTVRGEAVALDDPLRWRLVDCRALSVTGQHDHLWARILDAPAALAARRYRVPDRLVVEIADGFRPQHAGRYRVEGDPTGAEAARVDAEPDLVMDVATLGSLYLGGVGAAALGRSGRIVERTPGALSRADLFFGTDRAPFCPTNF